jgi:hypothetical protein
MPPKIANKIFLKKTLNNFPRKIVDTTFSQTLQWILCQGRLMKILNSFFKFIIKFTVGQKKQQNSAKKIIKKSFLEEIFLKFQA